MKFIFFTVITLYSGFFAALIWNDITDKDIDIIVGSTHPSNLPNEWSLNCNRCKQPTYFIDKWDKADKEFICNICFLKANKKAELVITNETRDNVNNILEADFSKRNLITIVKKVKKAYNGVKNNGRTR